jgi:ribosomal protein S18 acetylase RimI-like enzyme
MTSEVRAFAPGDRDAVREISYLTGLMGEPVDHFWRHQASWADVWTAYYTDNEPESLSVATVDNSVVGYLAGCIDTSKMRPTTDEAISTAMIRHGLFLRPGTGPFFLRAMVDSWRDRGRPAGELNDPRWPSHLHIDLLPEARGTGLADALMDRWLSQCRDRRSPGCHLATLVENRRARAFFERFGFTDRGTVLPVPGLRGNDGERLHQVVMIKSL